MDYIFNISNKKMGFKKQMAEFFRILNHEPIRTT